MDGRGEFFDKDVYEGREIVIRYAWSDITSDSAHFEQAFSTDDGKTWQTNWITDQKRRPELKPNRTVGQKEPGASLKNRRGIA